MQDNESAPVELNLIVGATFFLVFTVGLLLLYRSGCKQWILNSHHFMLAVFNVSCLIWTAQQIITNVSRHYGDEPLAPLFRGAFERATAVSPLIFASCSAHYVLIVTALIAFPATTFGSPHYSSAQVVSLCYSQILVTILAFMFFQRQRQEFIGHVRATKAKTAEAMAVADNKAKTAQLAFAQKEHDMGIALAQKEHDMEIVRIEAENAIAEEMLRNQMEQNKNEQMLAQAQVTGPPDFDFNPTCLSADSHRTLNRRKRWRKNWPV